MSQTATPKRPTPADLKGLQTRARDLRSELDRVKAASAEYQRQRDSLQRRLTEVERQIQSFSAAAVTVSEHAMLRYLERVMGVDMAGLRETILPPDVRATIDAMGNGTYPVGDGAFKVRVQNRVVVTVLVEREVQP